MRHVIPFYIFLPFVHGQLKNPRQTAQIYTSSAIIHFSVDNNEMRAIHLWMIIISGLQVSPCFSFVHSPTFHHVNSRPFSSCPLSSHFTPSEEWDSDSPSSISFANENDSLEYKRQVGDQIQPPSRTYLGPPIFLPPGENRPSYPATLPFTLDNVQGVLEACRRDIGTMFGYTAENRGVGITGAVDLVDVDGPILTLELSGRFWHPRSLVLQRIKSYMQTRIPELMDVLVSDESQLDDLDPIALDDDTMSF
jgi:hypothetical protein